MVLHSLLFSRVGGTWFSPSFWVVFLFFLHFLVVLPSFWCGFFYPSLVGWCCLVSSSFGWCWCFFPFLLRGAAFLLSFGWGCVRPLFYWMALRRFSFSFCVVLSSFEGQAPTQKEREGRRPGRAKKKRGEVEGQVQKRQRGRPCPIFFKQFLNFYIFQFFDFFLKKLKLFNIFEFF